MNKKSTKSARKAINILVKQNMVEAIKHIRTNYPNGMTGFIHRAIAVYAKANHIQLDDTPNCVDPFV